MSFQHFLRGFIFLLLWQANESYAQKENYNGIKFIKPSKCSIEAKATQIQPGDFRHEMTKFGQVICSDDYIDGKSVRKCGIISKSGEFILPKIFKSISILKGESNIAFVELNASHAIYDLNIRKIIDTYDRIIFPDDVSTYFIAMKSEIVVGGEQVMYYPIEKHDHDTVNTYFLNIAQGPQCFPNTGFIMGKTEIVKKLFESNLGYNDDQAACIDAIFEGRQIIDIDYRTELIGNVPKYKDGFGNDYFQLDSRTNRHVSVKDGTSPIVLHFPGKNFAAMDAYYNQGVIVTNTDTEETNYIPGVIVIILLVLIMLYAAYILYKN